MKMNLKDMTLETLSSVLRRRECSSEELTRAYLDQISERDREIGAFLTVDREEAIRTAKESDLRRKNGAECSLLDGIPFAVKDNFCTKGLRTTCASRMLENYIPPYNATVVGKLRDAGCILLGKLNMDEFAMGSSTQHSAFGVTRNPRDPERVPGGSSGGSAAAVAAGEVPFALGTDTGGSVRQPASFCGTVGFKPTYGAISRYGVISFASSLDCVGTVTNTAADALRVFRLLAGKDPHDATSGVWLDADALNGGNVMKKRLRVAVIPDAGMGTLSDPLKTAVQTAVERFRDIGAEIIMADLPSPEQALLSYCVISAVEAASNLARFDGIRYGIGSMEGGTPAERRAAIRGAGFGKEVKFRILFGTAMLSGNFRERYYLPACHIREQIRQAIRELFTTCDLILKPTAPCGAFRLDEPITALRMREMDLCTVYASLAGIPAISVPVGTDENRMPLGIQLMADAGRDGLVLHAAEILEGKRYG